MRVMLPLLVVALRVVVLSDAAAQEPAKTDAPYARDATAETKKDPEKLARLETPGKVLFTDGFDSDKSFEQWFEVADRKDGRARIMIEPKAAHGGDGALVLTATKNDGKSRGAWLAGWLGDAGHDCVHMRYWIRYAPDYDQGNLHHTGGSLCGVAGNDKWAGMGTAGKKPNGDDHFDMRVEGWRDWQRVAAPGQLMCYTYWMDMRRDRDGNFWGNMLAPEPEQRFLPPRGEWHCIEQRIAVNTPGKPDGELAVWVDGKLYVHYVDMRWRSTADVRIKRIGLLVYVHEARRDNTAWYDDLVVSTGYIGTGGPAAEVKPPSGR